MAMHNHGGFVPLGKLQQMPGIFALFEDAILNHRTPVIIVKDEKGVIDIPIGEARQGRRLMVHDCSTSAPPPH
jgi:hypothetical protein